MKITEHIYQVGGGALSDPDDGAVYLIRFGEQGALVDAGCGRSVDRLIRNIQACGTQPEQVKFLLITHCHFDHTGGIRGVREKTGCRVAAHEKDACFLEEGNNTVTAAKWYGAFLPPTDIDIRLRGARNELELGSGKITALHTPGHSPGSVVYVTESEDLKVLFGQDVHGPIHESLLSNLEDYRKSLRLLLALEADILCEGHYGVIRGKEEVTDFIGSFL